MLIFNSLETVLCLFFLSACLAEVTSVDHFDPGSHFLHFNLLNAHVQVNVVWDSV